MKKKNIILLIVSILLIIGGCVMVGVKGFNVRIYLREHDTLKFVFEQAFEKSDVKNVCEEVFGDKKFEVRTLEVFDDAVYIMATEITEEEEEALLTKLSALYADEEEETADDSTEETSEEIIEDETSEEVSEESSEETEEATIFDELTEGTDYEFYHDSKIRLRDISKPYVIPTVIAAVIIIICMMVRYGIMKSKHVVLKTLEVCIKSGILLLDILAIIALTRISVSAWLLPCVMFIVMIYLIGTFEYEIRRKDEETD